MRSLDYRLRFLSKKRKEYVKLNWIHVFFYFYGLL